MGRGPSVVCLVVICHPVSALDWVHTDVQLLYGDGIILDESQRATVTVEHAHGWSYGDSFFFVDLHNHVPQQSGVNLEAYGEWYSTLSLNKLFGFQGLVPYVNALAFSAGVNAGSRPTVSPPTLHF